MIRGAILAILFSAGCGMTHVVGGNSSHDVFHDDSVRRLADAGCVGNRTEIKRLVEQGVDPNSRGLDDATPLLWAISCGNLPGVTGLIDSGADVNLNGGAYFPIVIAASRDNSDILRELLINGANPNPKLTKGARSALQEAVSASISYDNIGNLDALLLAGADPNYKYCDGSACDVLHDAIYPNRPKEAMRIVNANYKGCDEQLLNLIEIKRDRQTENREYWNAILIKLKICRAK